MSSAATTSVARRRAAAPHTSMFLRMLVRAAVLRRGRAASALLAMVVAAAVATAMLNLYVDVQAKLRREFRKYGANVVVVAKDGQELPAERSVDSVGRYWAVAASQFRLLMPWPALADGRSVVVAGTDLDQVRKLDSWWSVTAWPKAAHDALVGNRAVGVRLAGKAVWTSAFKAERIRLNPGGHLANGRRRRQPGLYLARRFHRVDSRALLHGRNLGLRLARRGQRHDPTAYPSSARSRGPASTPDHGRLRLKSWGRCGPRFLWRPCSSFLPPPCACLPP